MSFYKTMICALAALLLVASCDVIQNPIQDGEPVSPPDTSTYTQNVLLEDYTGHVCGNCPAAADEAYKIQDQFTSDRVIVVGVHAGPFARTSSSYPTDWTCPESVELDNNFRISRAGNPNGLVNRTVRSGKFILSKDDWAPATVVELAKEPRLGILAESTWDEASKTVTVDVSLKFLKEGTIDYHLVGWIIENGLVSDQLDYRKTPSHVEDFEFEHVLRGSINGTWGERLSETLVAEGTDMQKQLQYTFPSDKDWKPENCDVVIFVHQHQTTLEVVNVTKVHVTGK